MVCIMYMQHALPWVRYITTWPHVTMATKLGMRIYPSSPWNITIYYLYTCDLPSKLPGYSIQASIINAYVQNICIKYFGKFAPVPTKNVFSLQKHHKMPTVLSASAIF